jgi:hypothetical protein
VLCVVLVLPPPLPWLVLVLVLVLVLTLVFVFVLVLFPIVPVFVDVFPPFVVFDAVLLIFIVTELLAPFITAKFWEGTDISILVTLTCALIVSPGIEASAVIVNVPMLIIPSAGLDVRSAASVPTKSPIVQSPLFFLKLEIVRPLSAVKKKFALPTGTSVLPTSEQVVLSDGLKTVFEQLTLIDTELAYTLIGNYNIVINNNILFILLSYNVSMMFNT